MKTRKTMMVLATALALMTSAPISASAMQQIPTANSADILWLEDGEGNKVYSQNGTDGFYIGDDGRVTCTLDIALDSGNYRVYYYGKKVGTFEPVLCCQAMTVPTPSEENSVKDNKKNIVALYITIATVVGAIFVLKRRA